MNTIIKTIGLSLIACLLLSGCSCREWGYCPQLFPNAERLADSNNTR